MLRLGTRQSHYLRRVPEPVVHGELLPTPSIQLRAVCHFFIAVYLENTHGEGVHRVPGKWHTANSAFAVPMAVVGGSPSATLSEMFAVCQGDFTRRSLEFQ